MKTIPDNFGSTRQLRLITIQIRRQLKYLFLLVALIILFFSCDESDSGGTDSIVTPPVPVEETSPLVIDSTDLIILPIDTGGSHTAYPLNSTDAVYGHYVYTPGGYSSDGPEYPLLIFLHGWDVTDYTGTDEEELDELLFGTTPPGLIHADSWNPSFPFIVASPRLKTPWYWDH